MRLSQKQYSSFNILPNNENEIISVISRKLIKKEEFFNLNAKNEIPLFLYLTNLLLALKNNKMLNSSELIIKKSKLRNFLRKKCHSDSVENLNNAIDDFFFKLEMNVLKTETMIVNRISEERYEISFSTKYLKSLEKNTVSLNILDITKIRGERAKKIFIKIHSFDMRNNGERYFTLINLSDFLNLDWRMKRKSVIRTIKNAFNSLSLKGYIKNTFYTGEIAEKNESYKFKYTLANIQQLIK